MIRYNMKQMVGGAAGTGGLCPAIIYSCNKYYNKRHHFQDTKLTNRKNIRVQNIFPFGFRQKLFFLLIILQATKITEKSLLLQ